MEKSPKQARRDFLGTIAAGAAAMGMATLATPFTAAAGAMANYGNKNVEDADAWFAKVKGKHRIVFDVTQPHEMMPFAWPKVFQMTNAATGTPQNDTGVVVIFRHEGIPFAFEDRIWEKYKFGEVFKYNDPKTKAPSTRNPFYKSGPDDFKVPGLGSVDLAIEHLQANGVMFCVCDVAMSVYSAALAGSGDPAAIKKDWMSGLLPGFQVVPSGVWAVGRAQEHGCAYCFAG